MPIFFAQSARRLSCPWSDGRKYSLQNCKQVFQNGFPYCTRVDKGWGENGRGMLELVRGSIWPAGGHPLDSSSQQIHKEALQLRFFWSLRGWGLVCQSGRRPQLSSSLPPFSVGLVPVCQPAQMIFPGLPAKSRSQVVLTGKMGSPCISCTLDRIIDQKILSPSPHEVEPLEWAPRWYQGPGLGGTRQETAHCPATQLLLREFCNLS